MPRSFNRLEFKLEISCVVSVQKDKKKYQSNIETLAFCEHRYSDQSLLCFNISFFFYLWHLAWGNTYSSTVNPLFLPQKKGLCVIAFSEYREHTSSLFANFMHDYHSGNQPSSFNLFFLPKLTKDIVTTQDLLHKWVFLCHKFGLIMENLSLDSPG